MGESGFQKDVSIMEDKDIITLYWERSQEAIRATEAKCGSFSAPECAQPSTRKADGGLSARKKCIFPPGPKSADFG